MSPPEELELEAARTQAPTRGEVVGLLKTVESLQDIFWQVASPIVVEVDPVAGSELSICPGPPEAAAPLRIQKMSDILP